MKHKLKLYGKWFYAMSEKTVQEALENGLFPDGEFETIHVISGNGKETFKDIPETVIKQCKKEGATHVMIGRGDTCSVYTIDGEELTGNIEDD